MIYLVAFQLLQLFIPDMKVKSLAIDPTPQYVHKSQFDPAKKERIFGTFVL